MEINKIIRGMCPNCGEPVHHETGWCITCLKDYHDKYMARMKREQCEAKGEQHGKSE